MTESGSLSNVRVTIELEPILKKSRPVPKATWVEIIINIKIKVTFVLPSAVLYSEVPASVVCAGRALIAPSPEKNDQWRHRRKIAGVESWLRIGRGAGA